MSKSGPTFRLLSLAFLNLLRKPGRSLAALLGVALAASFAYSGTLITAGVHHALGVGLARLGADLMVVPAGATGATHQALVLGEPAAFYMPAENLKRVAGVAGVEWAAPQVFVETLASAACCTGRLMVIGFDSGLDFTVRPWLRTGVGRELVGNEILVGNHVLSLPGEPMRLYGSDYQVVDRLEPTGMGIDETVFLPLEAVWQMARDSEARAEKALQVGRGEISTILVDLADGAAPERVAAVIRAEVGEVEVLTPGSVTASVAADLKRLMAHLLPVAYGGTGIAVLLFLLLFSAAAAERGREIGLMRAMGATAAQVVGLLLGEAALLGLLGAAAGVLAGTAIYALFQEKILVSYVLPFLWPSPAAQAWAAVGVVIGGGAFGAGAAFGPVWRVVRRDPFFGIHLR